MSDERSLGNRTLPGDRLGVVGAGASLDSGLASGGALNRREPSDKYATAEPKKKEERHIMRKMINTEEQTSDWDEERIFSPSNKIGRSPTRDRKKEDNEEARREESAKGMVGGREKEKIEETEAESEVEGVEHFKKPGGTRNMIKVSDLKDEMLKKMYEINKEMHEIRKENRDMYNRIKGKLDEDERTEYVRIANRLHQGGTEYRSMIKMRKNENEEKLKESEEKSKEEYEVTLEKVREMYEKLPIQEKRKFCAEKIIRMNVRTEDEEGGSITML